MNLPENTIVALSTAPGVGAISVIRLSGEKAITLTNSFFEGKDLEKVKGGTFHFGKILNGTVVIDEVVVSVFKSPHSYTGEDVVEISCHGSPYIIQEIIRLCLEAGASLAEPGEFTQRAFLNGKMDLSQAEAVADLIASSSRITHDMAMHQMRGGFSWDLNHLREQLIEFTALLELELDFSEEDVEFADRSKFEELIGHLLTKTKTLLDSFRLGNAMKNGISVAIIGKPNAGKSTLLNTLLNEDRAIVSDIAGTTRDTIEETLNIHGVLFRLIDTAGIRDHTNDVIENIGIERSMANAAQSDIILLLIDMTSSDFIKNPDPLTEFPWLQEFKSKIILVNNKFLLWQNEPEVKEIKWQSDPDQLYIDARDQFGIETLKQKIFDRAIGGDINTENTIISNVRHRDLINY